MRTGSVFDCGVISYLCLIIDDCFYSPHCLDDILVNVHGALTYHSLEYTSLDLLEASLRMMRW